MLTKLLPLAVVAILALTPVGASAGQAPKDDDAKKPKSVYDFAVKNIDGKEVKLEQYKGDVLIIVNVASY